MGGILIRGCGLLSSISCEAADNADYGRVGGSKRDEMDWGPVVVAGLALVMVLLVVAVVRAEPVGVVVEWEQGTVQATLVATRQPSEPSQGDARQGRRWRPPGRR